MKPRRCVLITDLDNTLYDWLDIWHRSFRPMLDAIVAKSGIDERVLLSEFKRVYSAHGTSEYAFAIEELQVLQEKHPGADLCELYADAINAYRQGRRDALRLYPTVRETLLDLKSRGCLIVGYTGSTAFYSRYRLRRLGLDGLLDFLYSPPDHELPETPDISEVRHYEPEAYELKQTVHRHTSGAERKPSPSVLLSIVADVGARPEEAVYVGDDLVQDIGMARAAGITNVWAKYGTAHQRDEYELLKHVTHWTHDEVEQQQRTTQDKCPPDFELQRSFGELRDCIDWVSYGPRMAHLSPDESLRQIVEIWKKTVDVQQHFNDLELRIRNFAVTLLVGILTVSAFAMKEGLIASIGNVEVPLAVLILGAGVVGWGAFYLVDRMWYHRLLYGAVKHGAYLEARVKLRIPEICLTETIAAESPIPVGRKTQIHTGLKMDIFYGLIALGLIVGIVLLWVA